MPPDAPAFAPLALTPRRPLAATPGPPHPDDADFAEACAALSDAITRGVAARIDAIMTADFTPRHPKTGEPLAAITRGEG